VGKRGATAARGGGSGDKRGFKRGKKGMMLRGDAGYPRSNGRGEFQSKSH